MTNFWKTEGSDLDADYKGGDRRLRLFNDLVTHGLGGVRLVTSDAYQRLVDAVAANLPGTRLSGVQNSLRCEPDLRDAQGHMIEDERDVTVALRSARRCQCERAA